MRWLFLVLFVIGCVAPWYFFAQHFQTHGFSMTVFFAQMYSGDVPAGTALDLTVSATAFLIWAGVRERGGKRYWLVFALTFLIGLSASAPLYFYLSWGRTIANNSAYLGLVTE